MERDMDITVKWKAGDKRIVTGNHNMHQFAIGEMVELVRKCEWATSRNLWECKDQSETNTWYVFESDMRPLTEEEREGLEPSPTRETECPNVDVGAGSKPARSRLAKVLGVEENKKWRYPECAGLYRVHNGVREYWDENNGWLYCDCEEDLVKIIAHPERIVRAPRLTEPEIAIMRAVGAKWVSRNTLGLIRVDLWNVKPFKTSNEIYVAQGIDPIARVKVELFPSVKQGECIGLEEER